MDAKKECIWDEPLSSSSSRDDSEVDFGLAKLYESNQESQAQLGDRCGRNQRGREVKTLEDRGRKEMDSRQLLEKRG